MSDFVQVIFDTPGPEHQFTFLNESFSQSPGVWSDDVSAVPLPAALPLFATGLGALGLLGWRRKRKASAVLAAA
jgi:hypothetical protein